MSEVSISKALSGSEALTSALDLLHRQLSKDDRFQSHMSYKGYRAEISFKFYPSLDFIPPVERDLTVENGEQQEIETEPTVDEKISIPIRPPNQVREESELPIPVLVTDGKGQSHEEWRRIYKRGSPKTKFVGGATEAKS